MDEGWQGLRFRSPGWSQTRLLSRLQHFWAFALANDFLFVDMSVEQLPRPKVRGSSGQLLATPPTGVPEEHIEGPT